MLRTFLTQQWGLRYPIIGAPMAGVAHGALARAISQAGGLGMIGIGSATPVALLTEESEIARNGGDRFGIGLMIWAIERRPELFEAALAARPFLLSLSFGAPAPYIELAHAAGALIATQVGDPESARAAEAAGVDLIVAQGAESGGHSSGVGGTLPLLQSILAAVNTPVVAAGGIASAAGLAAVLAAGAQGAWVGTAFLASPESAAPAEARRRIVAAQTGETVLTSLFDRVQGIPWPPRYPGRALRNRFVATWHGREAEMESDADARLSYQAAASSGDYDLAVLYAGEGVGLVNAERPAGAVVRALGDGAEARLRQVIDTMLRP